MLRLSGAHLYSAVMNLPTSSWLLPCRDLALHGGAHLLDVIAVGLDAGLVRHRAVARSKLAPWVARLRYTDP